MAKKNPDATGLNLAKKTSLLDMNNIQKSQQHGNPLGHSKNPFSEERKKICHKRFQNDQEKDCYWDFESTKKHIQNFPNWKQEELKDCLNNLQISVSDIDIQSTPQKGQEDKRTFVGLTPEGLQSFLTRYYSLVWILKRTPQQTKKGTVLFEGVEDTPYLVFKQQDSEKLDRATIFKQDLRNALEKVILEKEQEVKVTGSFKNQVKNYVMRKCADIGQKSSKNPSNYPVSDYPSIFPDIEEKPSALVFENEKSSKMIVPLDDRKETDLNWGKRPTAYLIGGVDYSFAVEANFKAVSEFFSPRFVLGEDGFKGLLKLIGGGLIAGATRSVRSAWIAGRGGDGKSALCNLIGAVLGDVFAKGKTEILIDTKHNLNKGAYDLHENEIRVACFDEFPIETKPQYVRWNDCKTMFSGDNPLEGRLGQGKGSFQVTPNWYSIISGNGCLKNVPNEHQKPLLDRLAFFEMQTGSDWKNPLKEKHGVTRFEDSSELKGGILWGILQGLEEYKQTGTIKCPAGTILEELPVYPWQIDETEEEYFRTADFRADLRELIGETLKAANFYKMGGIEKKNNRKKGDMRAYCEKEGFIKSKKINGHDVFEVLNFPAFDPDAASIELPST
ncbi:hypothetical protein FAI40_08645 [Acetobacteraceae bacterium]|nr:hypothetical protein FAI40_08645 [Acetobacteraceae bacterium]